MQGDIIAMLDANGDKVVEYGYDAWGKPLTGNPWHKEHPSDGTLTSEYEAIAHLNPFRYRGYVYDEETGLYYLGSRYYNPGTGRLINEDSLFGKTGALLSRNMFAYCSNYPIVSHDPNGRYSEFVVSHKMNANDPVMFSGGWGQAPLKDYAWNPLSKQRLVFWLTHEQKLKALNRDYDRLISGGNQGDTLIKSPLSLVGNMATDIAGIGVDYLDARGKDMHDSIMQGLNAKKDEESGVMIMFDTFYPTDDFDQAITAGNPYIIGNIIGETWDRNSVSVSLPNCAYNDITGDFMIYSGDILG